MNGTILVTGAAGFIGSHLVQRLLQDGAGVIGVDDLSAGDPTAFEMARTFAGPGAFETHVMDVRSEGMAALLRERRPEVVVHLAARARVAASVQDPVGEVGRDLVGTVGIVDACSNAGVPRVVFATSGGTIYGDLGGPPNPERDIARGRPVSPYGIGKRVALEYLRFYERSRGLDWVALALGNVYGPRGHGPGGTGVVAAFIERALTGRPLVVHGDGEQTRDFVHVDDVVEAFAVALLRGHGTAINIATGVETSVLELTRLVAEAVGGPPLRIEYGPPLEGEVRRVRLDVALAVRELGWRATTALREGIATTVAAFRS